MDDVLVLELPNDYQPGQEIHHPDDPPGEWDWLINLIIPGVREKLWGSVVEFVSHELDILVSPIREIRDRLYWLVAAISTIPNVAQNELRELRSQIVAAIAYWLYRLLSALDSLRDRAAGVIAAAPYVISTQLANSLAWLINVIPNAGHVVGGYLAAYLSPLLGPLWNLPGALLGGLVGHLVSMAQALWNAPAAIAGGVQMAIGRVEAFLQGLPDRVHQIWIQVQLFFWQQVASLWADAVGKSSGAWRAVLGLGTAVLPVMVQTLKRGPPPELAPLLTTFQGQVAEAAGTIQGLILGQGQVTPELAPVIGLRCFLAAAGTGFAAHLLATAIELAHPLRYIGLHYLSGFLGQLGSFNSIGFALTGVVVREAVANPMAYNIRARTRPTLPTAGDLQALRRKHNITLSEFAVNMAYQGYSDFWIQRFEEYLPADPRLLELTRLAETSLPTGAPPGDAIPLLERVGVRTREAPDWWLELKLALAGYNWIDIPQLKEVIKHKVSNTARLRLDAAASAAFRNGYLEEAAFRAILDRSDKTPDRIDMKVRAEKIGALVDDLNDLVQLYKDRFIKDVITEDEMLLALVNAGVTQRKARILVDRAVIQKLPKPAKPSTAAEDKALKAFQTKACELYRRQFEGDLVTADTYYNNLLAIGIEPRLATVTVQIAVTKRTITEREVAIKDAEKATTATRKVYEKVYREQFTAGALDADGYYDRLISIGLSPAEAEGTVALELVKEYQLVQRAEVKAEEKAALAEQKAGAELYVRRYRAGDIGDQELLTGLINLGIAEVLATTTVELEVLRRREEAGKVLAQVIVPALRVPFELAVAQLKAALAAGEITPAEFIEELVATGLAEDTAELILEFS